MICFLFIPVHWLFFAASTYVWVQYVWHTGQTITLTFHRKIFHDLLFFREGNLPTNSIPLATLRLYRGRCEAEGIQTSLRHQEPSISSRPLQAIRSSLVKASCHFIYCIRVKIFWGKSLEIFPFRFFIWIFNGVNLETCH